MRVSCLFGQHDIEYVYEHMSEDEDRDKKQPSVPFAGDPDTFEMPPLPDNPAGVSDFASMPAEIETLDDLDTSWKTEIMRELEQLRMNGDLSQNAKMEEVLRLFKGLSLEDFELFHETFPSSYPFETAPPDVAAILDSDPWLGEVGRVLLLEFPDSSPDVYSFLRVHSSGHVLLAPKTHTGSDTASATTAETFSSPPRKKGSRGSYNKEKDSIEYVSSATQTRKSVAGNVKATSETIFQGEQKLTRFKNRTKLIEKNFRTVKRRKWAKIIETTRDEVLKATKETNDLDTGNTEQEDESMDEETKKRPRYDDKDDEGPKESGSDDDKMVG